jgi:hypothetical protein
MLRSALSAPGSLNPLAGTAIFAATGITAVTCARAGTADDAVNVTVLVEDDHEAVLK